MDTRLVRTPRYYAQFSLLPGKTHIISLNSARLMRTPVNADNGHLLLAQNGQILIESQPRQCGPFIIYCARNRPLAFRG